MKADRTAQNWEKAKAALDPEKNPFLDVEAVGKVLQRAQERMVAIAQDARAYRLESDAKLRTISDPILRDSVDPAAKLRDR